MTFKQYLAESEKTYCYRLKTVSLLDKKSVATIEKYFQRFNLVKISTVRKTPLQKTPLDFESVSNREVFMLDVTLGLPISSFIMQRELVGILGLPGDYLLIRGENDPIEIQTDVIQQKSEIAQQAENKNLTADSLLGIISEYPEAEQTSDGANYYGDSYNGRLLTYLQAIADARREKEKIVAKAPLFSWLDLPKEKNQDKTDENDFNYYHGAEMKTPDPKAKSVSRQGNFDDEGVVVRKTYKTKSGETKTLVGKPSSIRKKD